MTVPTPPDPSALRASHEDRDRVAEALRVAAGDGRLTMDELEERLEAALTARTYSDLEALLTDLPVQGSVLPPPGVLTPSGLPAPIAEAVKDVVHIKRRGGSVKQEGPWLVPKALDVDLHGGSILLDFTQARISTQVTNVHVNLHGGSLRIYIPAGFAVDASEVEIRGGTVADRARKHAVPGTPITHQIIVSGLIRGGSVVIRPPREPGRGFLRRQRRRALPGA